MRVIPGATELAVVGTATSQLIDDQRVAFEPLLEDPLLLALARDHRLARGHTVDLDDLAGEPWISAGASPDEALLGVWPSLECEPHVAFIAREWTAKLGLVAAGLGVTVPGLAATAIRQDVALVRVRSKHPAMRNPAMRTIALATPAGTDTTPQARAFSELLHQVAAELTVELQRRNKRSLVPAAPPRTRLRTETLNA